MLFFALSGFYHATYIFSVQWAVVADDSKATSAFVRIKINELRKLSYTIHNACVFPITGA